MHYSFSRLKRGRKWKRRKTLTLHCYDITQLLSKNDRFLGPTSFIARRKKKKRKTKPQIMQRKRKMRWIKLVGMKSRGSTSSSNVCVLCRQQCSNQNFPASEEITLPGNTKRRGREKLRHSAGNMLLLLVVFKYCTLGLLFSTPQQACRKIPFFTNAIQHCSIVTVHLCTLLI